MEMGFVNVGYSAVFTFNCINATAILTWTITSFALQILYAWEMGNLCLQILFLIEVIAAKSGATDYQD